MFRGCRFAAICTLVAIALYAVLSGCAATGPRRAPVASLPDSMDVDLRTAELEMMAVEYPDDPEIFFTLGNTYYDQAVPDLARANYEKALVLDPKMIKARVNLAMLIAEVGETDSARVMLEDVLRTNPGEPRALTDLGSIYYGLKDVDTAVKYYNAAIKSDPQNPEAHYNLGMAFAESGLVLEAVREWRLVLELVSEGDTADRARLALERADAVLVK